MKRARSEPLCVGDIMHCIVTPVFEAIITSGYNFNIKERSITFFIFPDPTLAHGKCETVPDADDEHVVYMDPDQYYQLRELQFRVACTRLERLSHVPFPFREGQMTCEFKHAELKQDYDHVEWTIRLYNWEFDRRCYLGSMPCFESDKIADEALIAQNCTGKMCHQCKRTINCTIHPGQVVQEECHIHG